MNQSAVIVTGGLIVIAMARAYLRFRDPLHPLMFLGPLCFYVYVYQPLMLGKAGLLNYYFPDEGALEFVQAAVLLFILVFCLGLLKISIPSEALRSLASQPFDPSPRVKALFRRAALIMGTSGLLGFAYMSAAGPGILKAYSQYKGALVAVSGYIGESTLLTIPACILYIFSRQGEKWRFRHYALLAAFAMPHFLHAFLGARRGPAFSIMVALLVPWFMTRSRRPSLRTVFTSLLLVGVVVLFLFSHRGQIYIGSDFKFDRDRFVEKLKPSEDAVDQGNDYIYGSGLFLAARYNRYHFWGRRYAVLMLVRPIPRQLWPTKYEDTGMAFIVEEGARAGMDDSQWLDAIGWIPYRGSAPGLVSDLFLEFGWLGLAGIWLAGAGLACLWKNAVLEKGLWGVLYSLAVLLSVYLPAQGVTAFLYRFVFMSIPCALLWYYLVHRAADSGSGDE
ncbi:MAG TPA: hypothetical protein PKM67_03045 [Kiritimatiellia bacterium]|nr:hypothetical protein [Kiritimatiellia bacterium]